MNEQLDILNKEYIFSYVQYIETIFNFYVEDISDDVLVSPLTKKSISKRVSENGAKKFTHVKSLPSLVKFELAPYLERIRIYPYITKYREPIKDISKNDKDMFVAWQLHSQSLRQNELYVIQERGVDIIEFIHLSAKDMGVCTEDQSKVFEKEFKKTFNNRLRDRHRVVHAHERPSLTSRIIDTALIMGAHTTSEERKYFLDTALQLTENLPPDMLDGVKNFHDLHNKVANYYVALAEQEAKSILHLFFSAMMKTLLPDGLSPLNK